MYPKNWQLIAFQYWLDNPEDVKQCKYYVGNLGNDRYLKWALIHPEINIPVNALAEAAWDAHIAGKVHLTQRKLGDGRYAYYATKAKGARQ